MINFNKAKMYCREYWKIENFKEAVDSPEKWECHHRNEEYYSQNDLKKLGLYYGCPPCELIFLKRSEHRKLESFCKRASESKKGDKNHNYGKHHSEETKLKISEAMKGENHPFYGNHHSEESRQKISEAKKVQMKSCREAYKLSGRKDWNAFQKEYFKQD